MITEKRKEQRREAQKRYKQTAKGKASQKKYYTSEAKKESSKRWRQKNANSIKIKAHRLVDKAIKLGFLKKEPCTMCNDGKAFAHHDDYTKPLEVRWLCNFHHTEYHRNVQN